MRKLAGLFLVCAVALGASAPSAAAKKGSLRLLQASGPESGQLAPVGSIYRARAVDGELDIVFPGEDEPRVSCEPNKTEQSALLGYIRRNASPTDKIEITGADGIFAGRQECFPIGIEWENVTVNFPWWSPKERRAHWKLTLGPPSGHYGRLPIKLTGTAKFKLTSDQAECVYKFKPGDFGTSSVEDFEAFPFEWGFENVAEGESDAPWQLYPKESHGRCPFEAIFVAYEEEEALVSSGGSSNAEYNISAEYRP